jgi:anti-anti-sigma regulatory factor
MPAKKKNRSEKPQEKAAKSFVILLDGTEDASEPGSTVELAKDSTMSSVTDLRERLQAALDSGDPVTIDAGAAEEVDTAVVQLLCSFVRSAEAREIGVHWHGESGVVRDTACRLGLDTELSLQ